MPLLHVNTPFFATYAFLSAPPPRHTQAHGHITLRQARTHTNAPLELTHTHTLPLPPPRPLQSGGRAMLGSTLAALPEAKQEKVAEMAKASGAGAKPAAVKVSDAVARTFSRPAPLLPPPPPPPPGGALPTTPQHT